MLAIPSYVAVVRRLLLQVRTLYKGCLEYVMLLTCEEAKRQRDYGACRRLADLNFANMKNKSRIEEDSTLQKPLAHIRQIFGVDTPS